ncbi:MAG: enoyl-CoA hydratase/isomerase family protein [Planctomycetota bacterium]
MSAVETRRAGAALWITIAAPERGNSLDVPLLDGLTQAFREVEPDVRAVLLTGAGSRHFCTGYHLPTLLAELDQGPSVVDDENHPLEQALRALDAIAVPTIAVIQGPAYGAGCELALTCDLRLAATGASLCMPPTKLGILYSYTGLRRLVRLVGGAQAKRLIYTAAPVGAEEALRLGLVTGLAAPESLLADAQALAEAIAANSARAVADHKTLFRWIEEGRPYPEVQDEVRRLRAECFASPELAERVARLRHGRPRG